MKRMFCILAATIILAVFMTGCGCSDRGKIGDGNNGTYSDNTNQNATANKENTTENKTDNATNTTDTTNDTTNNGNTNDNNNNAGNDTTGNILGNDENGTIDNNATESYTEDSSQEGLAGRVGDAIDEGIYGIEEGLTGNDNNTQPVE